MSCQTPSQSQRPWFRQTVVAMKLTAILILAACLQVSVKGYTQDNITFNEKNAVLDDVFKDFTEVPIDIEGKVVNEKGYPIEGVRVIVKGASQTTSTNTRGEFILSTVDQGAVLVFTSVHIETLEFEVYGKIEKLVIRLSKSNKKNGAEGRDSDDRSSWDGYLFGGVGLILSLLAIILGVKAIRLNKISVKWKVTASSKE